MEKILYEFFEHIKRKFAHKTLKDYVHILNDFYLFVKENYPDVKEITDVSRDIILGYEKYLLTKIDRTGKIISRNRRYKYLLILKIFFLYLEREELIYANPTVNMSLPKFREPLIKNVLTIEEMDTLLKSSKGDNIQSLRDRAILELLYSSGIRSNELCNIRINDIDLTERTLFIKKGKGDKERYVVFGESAEYWLKSYLEKARPLMRGSGSEYLFLTSRGVAFKPDTLHNLIESIVRKSGLEKKVTPHNFRNTCATHLLQGKADIRYIQRLLGHKKLSTTEKYLKIEISDLKEIHKRCHPREQDNW